MLVAGQYVSLNINITIPYVALRKQQKRPWSRFVNELG